MTLTEKIIARTAGRAVVRPDEEVWANVDLATMHDSSGPRRIAPTLEKLGGQLWDRQKVVLVIDHFAPAANQRHAEIVKLTRDWAREMDVPYFFDSAGVMHNILLEEGLARPGMLVVGADSHTVTAGAVGALAIGVGSTELATVLVTGQIWLRVPPTVLIRFEDTLPAYLMARDMAMAALRTLRADFATYKSVEYTGSAVDTLDVDERAVLANQAIEMGAKNGIVPPSGEVLERLGPAAQANGYPVAGDEDAEYETVHHVPLASVPPLVAAPPNVDNIAPATEFTRVEVNRVYIGSCVGGKLSDLRAVARILTGNKSRVPLQVVPATKRVLEAALRDGTLQTLLEGEAIVQAPGCGACAGLHSGLLGPRERVITTVTRNYPGRMGDPSAEIYLASPLTAAASAVTGRITDPREFL